MLRAGSICSAASLRHVTLEWFRNLLIVVYMLMRLEPTPHTYIPDKPPDCKENSNMTRTSIMHSVTRTIFIINIVYIYNICVVFHAVEHFFARVHG